MKISTKGRYAMRFMIELAQNVEKGLNLKDIAEKQEMPLKYLEQIALLLVKAKLIVGKRGPNGGYALTRAPKNYTALEILTVMEGSLAPVECLECRENFCPRKQNCPTLKMWQGFDKLIHDYFRGITLEDLVAQSNGAWCYQI